MRVALESLAHSAEMFREKIKSSRCVPIFLKTRSMPEDVRSTGKFSSAKPAAIPMMSPVDALAVRAVAATRLVKLDK